MGLQQATSDQFDAKNLFMSVHLHLGEVLYRLIPEKTRKRFLPYNDAAVSISDKRYVIRFTSLQQKKTPNGTLYYSRHQPKIEIAGEELVVAFTGHAIERICERQLTQGTAHFREQAEAWFADVLGEDAAALMVDRPPLGAVRRG
jgi:hypothetical protein